MAASRQLGDRVAAAVALSGDLQEFAGRVAGALKAHGFPLMAASLEGMARDAAAREAPPAVAPFPAGCVRPGGE